jgi:D-sedoheptulose 7-phosphate isomerase
MNPGLNLEAALAAVQRSMEEGANLRLKVARESGAAIVRAAETIIHCLQSGGKLLLFGNGGSAADAQHLAAEFVGRFVMERRALPAIALTTDSSIVTAIGNDYGYDFIFSRQLDALAHANDVAIGISTSGNSANVLIAIRKATELGLSTIALAGKDGGALSKAVEIPIVVNDSNTARIQECHITIGHIWCELVERRLFSAP